MIGADAGTAEAAAEYGALHIPDVECTSRGIPLVSDLFRIGQRHAVHPWLCFANADVILMQDFIDALRVVINIKKRCVIVGRRWNLDVQSPLEFTNARWTGALRAEVNRRGNLFVHDAMDYFVFPKGFYTAIPPMAIGREGWDNWMIYAARKRLAPVVDMTSAATVVHQNHDYGRFKDIRERRESDETQLNRMFVGRGFFDLRDATHELVNGDVVPTWKKNMRWHIWRATLLFPALKYALWPLSKIKRTLGNTDGR